MLRKCSCAKIVRRCFLYNLLLSQLNMKALLQDYLPHNRDGTDLNNTAVRRKCKSIRKKVLLLQEQWLLQQTNSSRCLSILSFLPAFQVFVFLKSRTLCKKGCSAAVFPLAPTDLNSVSQNQKCILQFQVRNIPLYPQLRPNTFCINIWFLKASYTAMLDLTCVPWRRIGMWPLD